MKQLFNFLNDPFSMPLISHTVNTLLIPTEFGALASRQINTQINQDWNDRMETLQEAMCKKRPSAGCRLPGTESVSRLHVTVKADALKEAFC